jgi:hypothetical protein
VVLKLAEQSVRSASRGVRVRPSASSASAFRKNSAERLHAPEDVMLYQNYQDFRQRRALVSRECQWRHDAQLAVTDSKNAITLARSSADVSPPYGFMLLPGTTSSGFAMKRSSFSLSHTKSASFMALE